MRFLRTHYFLKNFLPPFHAALIDSFSETENISFKSIHMKYSVLGPSWGFHKDNHFAGPHCRDMSVCELGSLRLKWGNKCAIEVVTMINHIYTRISLELIKLKKILTICKGGWWNTLRSYNISTPLMLSVSTFVCNNYWSLDFNDHCIFLFGEIQIMSRQLNWKSLPASS